MNHKDKQDFFSLQNSDKNSVFALSEKKIYKVKTRLGALLVESLCQWV